MDGPLHTFIVVCCVCGTRIRTETHPPRADGKHVSLSHSYCDPCARKTYQEAGLELPDNLK